MAWRLPTPRQYLNQCWIIVNWTHRNKHQWNLNQNFSIFIKEIVFENIIWKMAAILSRPACDKGGHAVYLMIYVRIFLAVCFVVFDTALGNYLLGSIRLVPKDSGGGGGGQIYLPICRHIFVIRKASAYNYHNDHYVRVTGLDICGIYWSILRK